MGRKKYVGYVASEEPYKLACRSQILNTPVGLDYDGEEHPGILSRQFKMREALADETFHLRHFVLNGYTYVALG